MTDINNVNSIYSKISEITAKGKNVADYEVQHTKRGFTLRNKNSFLTKISKLLNPEQYDTVKNITVLAAMTNHFSGKKEAHFDEGVMHKALSLMLGRQITSSSSTEKKDWNTVNAVLNALGGTFIAKRNARDLDKLEPLQAFLTTIKQEIAAPNAPVLDTLQELLPRLRQDLESYRELRHNPAAQNVLKKELTALLTAVQEKLPHQDGLPSFKYERVKAELGLTAAAFRQLLPDTDSTSPLLEDCDIMLDRLYSKNDPTEIMREMIARSGRDQINPLQGIVTGKTPLQMSLERLQKDAPSEYNWLITSPRFAREKDELLHRMLTTALPSGTFKTEHRAPPPRDMAPLPTFDEAAEEPKMHALVTKWLAKLPNPNVIRQTLGREDLSAIVINGNKMAQARVDAHKALQTKNSEFEAYAKVALIAEELATEMRRAAPNKTPAEIEGEVAALMSMTPKDYNPFGDLPIALQTFVQLMGGPGDVPLSLSSTIGDANKQVEDRFAFVINPGNCKLHIKGVYSLSDGETKRLMDVTATVEKTYGVEGFQGRLALAPQ